MVLHFDSLIRDRSYNKLSQPYPRRRKAASFTRYSEEDEFIPGSFRFQLPSGSEALCSSDKRREQYLTSSISLSRKLMVIWFSSFCFL